MQRVGTVTQVWRYPVKSFQGEQVESIEIGPGGAVGDRTLAVVDPAERKVLTAKLYADLLQASARVTDSGVVITLPDGAEWEAADPGVHDALSAWLDKEVKLAPPPTDEVFPMEMYSGMSDEDTPLFDWPGPMGTWLDLADAHWLTTASLAAMAAAQPEADWDVRRFRPNALIEAEGEGLVEDGWTKVEIGDVASEVLMPTPRCSIPSRGQPGLSRDKSIAATIRDTNANNLGIYASVTRAGTIRVGDSVNAS